MHAQRLEWSNVFLNATRNEEGNSNKSKKYQIGYTFAYNRHPFIWFASKNLSLPLVILLT